MYTGNTYIILLFLLFAYAGNGQDKPLEHQGDAAFQEAYDLALGGEHGSAQRILEDVLHGDPENIEARSLLANIYSREGQYDLARPQFNRLTSENREDVNVWTAAIMNELHAKNNATALGLAQKALLYVKRDTVEINRLKAIALQGIVETSYSNEGWHNQESGIPLATGPNGDAGTGDKVGDGEEERPVKDTEEKNVLRNRIDFSNSVTVFDQHYDPMLYSSISWKHQTRAGSLIPRINYSNRLGKNGLQYDLDLYPIFSKRLYAYLNYGYSNSTIYPRHKVGGDLYVNLPGAFEFSAGGRYIVFETQDVSVITNSLGHYRGNYYFSLRSYITPRPDGLTQFSGNLLVRKYLRDAENYFGLNVGMGYSPELRQIISGEELLAETMLYVESQRLGFEYQFTGKKGQNAYRANIGATRQELSYAQGEFFYGVTAGLTYQIKF